MARRKIEEATSADAASVADRAASLVPVAHPDGVGGWLSRRLSVAALVSALKSAIAPAPINSGEAGSAGTSAFYAPADHAHPLDISGFSQLTTASDVDPASWVLATAKATATPAVPLRTYKMSVAAFFTSRTLTGCVLSGGDAQQTKLSGVKWQCRPDLTGASSSITGVTAGNHVRVLLTQPHTFTLPNLLSPTVLIGEGERYELVVEAVQDAAGGRTIAFVAPAGATLEWGATSIPEAYREPNSSTFFHFSLRRPRATEPDAGAQKWQGRLYDRERRGFHDIELSVQPNGTGPNWPTRRIFAGNIGCWAASGSQMTICAEGQGHPNHGVVPGAPIYLHFHFAPLDAVTAGQTINLEFEFCYAAGHGEEVFPTTTTTISTTVTLAAGDLRRHFVAEVGPVTLPTWKPDGLIAVQIRRRGDTDSYAGEIANLRGDNHAEIHGYSTRLRIPVGGSFA